MSAERFGASIPIKPWFHDHRFAGRTILPAVETMLFLGAQAKQKFPGLNIRSMRNARFAKFLEIPTEKKSIETLIEFEQSEQQILARLLSRKQLKIGSRIQEHGEVTFSYNTDKLHNECAITPEPLEERALQIPAEHIYRELVPFGPAYQSLIGKLHLSGDYAWGRLLAPDFSLAAQTAESLGSPFPLDGALHAACVYGQQYVDFIPFPVGFTQRTIFHPTQPGKTYFTKVQAVSRGENELLFDLIIFDKNKKIHEAVHGIHMRDVSGGRLKPPNWIRSAPL